MSMMPFQVLFPELAARECRTLTPMNRDDLPAHTYLLMELYCVEPNCDCRRVMLNVVDAQTGQHTATINHAFEPPATDAPDADLGQTFLDPLNPQSPLSKALLPLVSDMLRMDTTFRVRLERHYTMWKQVVDDPAHPRHARLHSARKHTRALPDDEPRGRLPQPVVRQEPRVGRNDPCPCGSGKKFKKCCGSAERPRPQATGSPEGPLSEARPSRQFAEFLRPLIEALPEQSASKALDEVAWVGQLAWNLAVTKEPTERARMLEEALAREPAGERRERLRRQLEELVARHETLFPEMHAGSGPRGVIGPGARQAAPTAQHVTFGALEEREVAELCELPQADETWAGGRRQPGFEIMQPRPFRPFLALWAKESTEAPGPVVAHLLQEAGAGVEGLWNALLDGMRRPLEGPPRRPARVALADPDLAERARFGLGRLGIEVACRPTPALDAIFEDLAHAVERRSEPQAYLGQGAIPPESVGRFFAAAAMLHRAAPWRHAHDEQVLEVRTGLPGVPPLCVSILGRARQVRGLGIFLSRADFERFLRLSDSLGPGTGPEAIQVSCWSLTFEPARELDPGQRDEIKRHGWEVAGRGANPTLLRLAPGGIEQPLTERDYRTVAACAEAVARFTLEHASVFKRVTGPGVSGSYECTCWPDSPGLQVTAPHPDG
jgi:hypothetical protein